MVSFLTLKYLSSESRESWKDKASIGASVQGLSHPWKLVWWLDSLKTLVSLVKECKFSIKGGVFMLEP